MAIDFPDSPALNDTHTVGNTNYIWDGVKWTASVIGGVAFDKIEEGNSSAEVIDTGSDGRFVVTTEGVERLRIDENGNVNIDSNTLYADATNNRVGVGTTSPRSTLTVAGQYSVDTNTTDPNDGSAYLFQQQGVGWNIASTNIAFTTGVSAGRSERLRIDSSGRLLVGTSSARGNFFNATATPSFQLDGGGFASITRSFNDEFASVLALAKSRGTGNTIVQSNDCIGAVSYQGNDGSEFVEAAGIAAFVDGTPGANDMPGRLVFSTTADGQSSPTERMRITSGGDICFNTTVVNGEGGISLGDGLGGARQFFWNRANTAAVTYACSFYNGGVASGSISYTNTATTYATSSDYRLKENVTPVTDGITRLQQLKPSRFNFIADPAKTVDGFLAHEVQTIVPEAITGEKDAVDDEGNPQYQGIDQSKLVPLLTAALQEAIGEIESLKARVAALESQP